MAAEYVLSQFRGAGRIPSLSPPCLKIHLALRRLGAPHRVVDLGPLQVRRTSPTGRVPVLEVDGSAVTDSVRILDALRDRHPGSDLFPGDPVVRAQDRAWDCVATDSLYWLGVYLRWLVPESRRHVMRSLFGPGPSLRRAVVSWFAAREIRARAVGQGVGRRDRADVARSYAEALAMVEAGLAGGPFLQGRDVPGRGDLAVAAHLAQALWEGAPPAARGSIEARPALAAHVRRTFESCGLPPP